MKTRWPKKILKILVHKKINKKGAAPEDFRLWNKLKASGRYRKQANYKKKTTTTVNNDSPPGC